MSNKSCESREQSMYCCFWCSAWCINGFAIGNKEGHEGKESKTATNCLFNREGWEGWLRNMGRCMMFQVNMQVREKQMEREPEIFASFGVDGVTSHEWPEGRENHQECL